jgi:hypothetical protein
MYQPYPTSGPEQEPERVKPQPPNSVRNAIKLMYAGAALSALAVIITAVTIGSLKAVILARHPDYTVTQLHRAEVANVTAAVIGGLIAIGLWLWMAWANGRGHSWARVVSAVLFGINTLDLLLSLSLRHSTAEAHATAAVIIGIVVWLVGLVAIVLLFNKQSSPFYKQQPAVR